MKNNSVGVPRLRFSEFRNEWDEMALKSVADIVTGNTPKTTEPKNYGDGILFVSPVDISEKRYVFKTKKTLSELGFSKSRVIPKNSILFVCIGSTIGKVAQNKFECSTNQQINSLIPFNNYFNDFIYSVLENNSSRIALLAGHQAVPLINKSDFSKILVYIPPTKKEQQKIADCLTSLDELINAQSQKVASLKQHKKGLMQQLFPQKDANTPQLRFSEFKNAPAWQEKKLGDVFTGKKGQGLSKADIVKNGKQKCILYGELYTKYSEVIKEVVSSTNINNGIKSKTGDLLIPCSTTTTAIDLANATALEECDVLIGGDISILRFKGVGSSVFFSYYINFCKKLELSKYGQGSTIVHLYYNHFKEMNICFPNPKGQQKPKEQQKIANCLTSLDELITAQSQKVASLKQHKQGLMQQLFPNNE